MYSTVHGYCQWFLSVTKGLKSGSWICFLRENSDFLMGHVHNDLDHFICPSTLYFYSNITSFFPSRHSHFVLGSLLYSNNVYMSKGSCVVYTFHLFKQCSDRLYLHSQSWKAWELPSFLIFH